MAVIKPPYPSFTTRYHNSAQPSALPTLPALSVHGKSVLITGGGVGGIGGETARCFAEAGASHIALLGRREGPLVENKAYIEEHYPKVKVFIKSTDVTKEDEVNAAFDEFKVFLGDEGKKVDIIIHSAATIGPIDPTASQTPISSCTAEAFLTPITANISASLHLARAFARHGQSTGVIIAINSWASYWSLNPSFASYSVSKIASWRVWDTASKANPGWRVYHTQPGVVLTEMNLATGGAASFEGVLIDDVSLPATFNLWLASDEAVFLKGRFLWCNWDIEELKARRQEFEGDKGLLAIGLGGWPFGEDLGKWEHPGDTEK